jgi:hypothetical protein
VLGNTEALKETHIHTYIHTHTHINTHIHTHIHTYIHTEPSNKKRLNIIEEVTVTVTPAYTGISQLPALKLKTIMKLSTMDIAGIYITKLTE